MKTNKALRKRIKITKNKKILTRKAGKGHFNAKQSRSKQLSGKKQSELNLGKKEKGRFLPYMLISFHA